MEQRLYWGTDFDVSELAKLGTVTQREDYLLDLDGGPYTRYNNVIDGVVQEDLPATKVLNHFNHAESGDGLSLNGSQLSIGPFHNSTVARMKWNVTRDKQR